MKWLLQVKRSKSDGYEIAAVREDNKHGQISWGWGGLDKIIFFASGVGGNQINVHIEKNWLRALRLAEIMTAALNEQDKE